MSNTNEQSIDFYKKFQEIKHDMSKASLEDVKNILDHYNQEAIEANGINYHYNISPLDAASLNARYKQLTGQDHPTFVNEQGKRKQPRPRQIVPARSSPPAVKAVWDRYPGACNKSPARSSMPP